MLVFERTFKISLDLFFYDAFCIISIFDFFSYGHLKAITVLLNESNCSPNVVNDNGSTPLHLAALQGKFYVVELLLSHQDIDVVHVNC
jgi:ankyrin repeat protein